MELDSKRGVFKGNFYRDISFKGRALFGNASEERDLVQFKPLNDVSGCR